MFIEAITRPSPQHKLYGIYHNHEYGGTHWLLWSEIFPNEKQVVETLGIDFELDKDEWISIEEVDSIETLVLS